MKEAGLGPEMIIDQRQIDASLFGYVAYRNVLKTSLSYKFLGAIENTRLGSV